MVRMLGVWLVLAVAVSAWAAEAPPALAVLVHAEAGGEALAEPFRTLLEVEASRTWEGGLVERTELAALLKELQLSALSSDAGTAAVQAGKMERAADLLLARVRADGVHVTVTGFPKTEILFDKSYTDRLEPESLATRVTADVLTALRGKARDPKLPYVAVGAFYCVDPHLRFMDFSKTIETTLRGQVGKMADVRQVERLFPSDLLNEFNLARGGLTVAQATDFNAPPADLLVYGECVPQKNQDLQADGILLDCTVTVVSPTNLLPTAQTTITVSTKDVTPLAGAAIKLLTTAVQSAHAALDKGQARGFSTAEFENFKKMAFKLMPTPPQPDGTFYTQGGYYGAGQWGPQAELERALRMLECASLFTGDDATVLDNTSTVLGGLQQRATTKALKDSLQEARMNLVERAYRLASTYNAREFYANTGLMDSRPDVVLNTARQIWKTRTAEAWYGSSVDNALHKLLDNEPDFAKRRQLFFDAAPAYLKRYQGQLFLLSVVQGAIRDLSGATDETAPVLAAHAAFADRLVAANEPVLQAYGHVLAMALAMRHNDLKPAGTNDTTFTEHARQSIALIPPLFATYHQEFSWSNYCQYVGYLLLNHGTLFAATESKRTVNDLEDAYLTALLKTDTATLLEVPHILRDLLPGLQERHEEKRAVELLDQALGMYTVGGAGDSDRQELTRTLNLLQQTLTPRPQLTLAGLTPIPCDDGKAGNVVKLVSARDGIVGLRVASHVHDGGKIFRVATGQARANVLTQVTGTVYDVACAPHAIGIGTEKDGFQLLDPDTLQAQSFTKDNSPLPSNRAWIVGSAGNDFLLGIPDKDNLYTLFYRLDPTGGKLTTLDIKLSVHPDWRIKEGDAKNPVAAQNWEQRTATWKNDRLTLRVKPVKDAVKSIIVSKDDGTPVFTYQGYALSYIDDFVVWKDYLVFATGNGLYVAKPGTNTLRCIMCEPDLLCYAFLPVGEQAYLGTSRGLYRMGAEQFTKVAL